MSPRKVPEGTNPLQQNLYADTKGKAVPPAPQMPTIPAVGPPVQSISAEIVVPQPEAPKPEPMPVQPEPVKPPEPALMLWQEYEQGQQSVEWILMNAEGRNSRFTSYLSHYLEGAFMAANMLRSPTSPVKIRPALEEAIFDYVMKYRSLLEARPDVVKKFEEEHRKHIHPNEI